MPQWLSDISGINWSSPVNSSPAADRMSDEIFGANHVLGGAEFTDALTQDSASLTLKNSLGPAKNYHVRPLGLAIICEEVKKE